MKYHSTYKKHDIYIQTEPGYSLKWESYVNGLFLHADTLQGIKRLINQYL